MNKLFFLFAGCVLLCSCDDDDSQTDTAGKVYFGHTHQTIMVLLDEDSDHLFRYQFQGNKIVKRKGGVRPISQNSGFNGLFTDDVRDEVSYEGSFVHIERFLTHPTSSFPPNRMTYLLSQQNQPVWQASFVEGYPASERDTMHYEYVNNRIHRTWKGHQQNTVISEYFFSSQNNLDSIVNMSYYEGVEVGSRSVAIFDDYDDKPNPLRKHWLFEDTYFRSLSRNNYRSYYDKQYLLDGTSVIMREVHYDIPYVNGVIRFDLH